MWMTSATAHSSAAAHTIWQIYAAVAEWPRWDKGTQQSSIAGSFTTGTQGILQPLGGPVLPFEIIGAVVAQGFSDRTQVGPDTTIVFRHILTPIDNGTQITHAIEIVGPDADQLAGALGEQLAHGLHTAVTGLARYAAEMEAKA